MLRPMLNQAGGCLTRISYCIKVALDTPWPRISEVAPRTKQWRLAYNQSRRQSPGNLERLEKWLLNRFCQKQSLHFGENERILFPERSWDYKKVGNKSSVERKYQWIPEEQVTAGVPAWRACQGQGLVPNPRRAGKALGICLFVVWFCFLNRDVPGGKGVVRNMIWY